MFAALQGVGRAADAKGAAVQDVGVDHGGLDVLGAQQLLNGAIVLVPLQRMGGLTSAQASVAETLEVAKDMAAGLFAYSGFI